MNWTTVALVFVLLIHRVDGFSFQPSLLTRLSDTSGYCSYHNNNNVSQKYHRHPRRRFMHSGPYSSSTCTSIPSIPYKHHIRLQSTIDDEYAMCDLFDEVGEEEEASSWAEEVLLDEECPADGPQCLLVDEEDLMDSSISYTDSTNIQSSVDTGEKSISFLPYDEDASEMELIMDKVLRFVPFFLPVIAFSLYDPTAIAFASVLDFVATQNWVAVDGGAYQAMIIAPVINGVVVTSVSLLFAIEIGLTISKLWKRKNDIQLCITMEATKLMVLRNLLADFPQTNKTQEKCQFYLLQYTSRLISECHETVNIALTDISQTDSELDGCMQELNKAAAASESTGYCDMLLDQAMAAVESLSQNRSQRISALQSTFPILHYALLATLASSICFAFLVETDQDILVFLNAIQLRLLWTMLVATFSALGLVCYDLEHPFRGFYQISDSVKELYDVRLEYTESLSSMGNDSRLKWQFYDGSGC